MRRIAETFVNLGLLKSEFVMTEGEPGELEAFGKATNGERAEILTGAEQIIIAGINSVRQASHTPQDQQRVA